MKTSHKIGWAVLWVGGLIFLGFTVYAICEVDRLSRMSPEQVRAEHYGTNATNTVTK